MKIVKFDDSKIVNLLMNARLVKNGEFGTYLEIDKNNVFKFYSEEFLSTYLYPSVYNLRKEVELMKDIDGFLIENGYTSKNKLEVLYDKMNRLEETACSSFIKAIVTYDNYPVGILTEHLNSYMRFTDFFYHMSYQDGYALVNKIKNMLLDLELHSIFVDNFNENNLFVRPKDKNIVFMNLDDKVTRYEDKDYIKNTQFIKKDAYKKHAEMVKRLNR